MSRSFEKETTSSTAKSLLGALIALGSGFIFMFLGLVVVTASGEKVEGERSARTLVSALQSDLLAYQSGTASVSADQKVLKFRRLGTGSAGVEVTYKVIPESGEVARIVGASSQKVAKVKSLRFEVSTGLLRLYWTSGSGEVKSSWALDRWKGKGPS
jgi:hypothetical protein